MFRDSYYSVKLENQETYVGIYDKSKSFQNNVRMLRKKLKIIRVEMPWRNWRITVETIIRINVYRIIDVETLEITYKDFN